MAASTMFDSTQFTTRSQDLEPAYHDTGQFYFGRTSSLARDGSDLRPRTHGLRVEHWRVQDIDTEDDWRRARITPAQLVVGLKPKFDNFQNGADGRGDFVDLAIGQVGWVRNIRLVWPSLLALLSRRPESNIRHPRRPFEVDLGAGPLQQEPALLVDFVHDPVPVPAGLKRLRPYVGIETIECVGIAGPGNGVRTMSSNFARHA